MIVTLPAIPISNESVRKIAETQISWISCVDLVVEVIAVFSVQI